MRRPGVILFLIAMLLGLATGDFVVAKETEPKQTIGTNLAVQTEAGQATTELEWHGEVIQ
ncbi:hypothetical protein EV586_103338 [Tumebacillus sp. BK434]|uniref:hypothetical protein n=1 Tax=Tumebacillus sp. BK434 TaxID=2512169 RepID=UPI00104688A6|nr:hypothetical protein [Tumebacillus sp. BK434]TCP55684.1 hypothetical protein EV586_103338 [Tumebacillus sp. BK434]